MKSDKIINSVMQHMNTCKLAAQHLLLNKYFKNMKKLRTKNSMTNYQTENTTLYKHHNIIQYGFSFREP